MTDAGTGRAVVIPEVSETSALTSSAISIHPPNEVSFSNIGIVVEDSNNCEREEPDEAHEEDANNSYSSISSVNSPSKGDSSVSISPDRESSAFKRNWALRRKEAEDLSEQDVISPMIALRDVRRARMYSPVLNISSMTPPQCVSPCELDDVMVVAESPTDEVLAAPPVNKLPTISTSSFKPVPIDDEDAGADDGASHEGAVDDDDDVTDDNKTQEPGQILPYPEEEPGRIRKGSQDLQLPSAVAPELNGTAVSVTRPSSSSAWKDDEEEPGIIVRPSLQRESFPPPPASDTGGDGEDTVKQTSNHQRSSTWGGFHLQDASMLSPSFDELDGSVSPVATKESKDSPAKGIAYRLASVASDMPSSQNLMMDDDAVIKSKMSRDTTPRSQMVQLKGKDKPRNDARTLSSPKVGRSAALRKIPSPQPHKRSPPHTLNNKATFSPGRETNANHHTTYTTTPTVTTRIAQEVRESTAVGRSNALARPCSPFDEPSPSRSGVVTSPTVIKQERHQPLFSSRLMRPTKPILAKSPQIIAKTTTATRVTDDEEPGMIRPRGEAPPGSYMEEPPTLRSPSALLQRSIDIDAAVSNEALSRDFNSNDISRQESRLQARRGAEPRVHPAPAMVKQDACADASVASDEAQYMNFDLNVKSDDRQPPRPPRREVLVQGGQEAYVRPSSRASMTTNDSVASDPSYMDTAMSVETEKAGNLRVVPAFGQKVYRLDPISPVREETRHSLKSGSRDYDSEETSGVIDQKPSQFSKKNQSTSTALQLFPNDAFSVVRDATQAGAEVLNSVSDFFLGTPSSPPTPKSRSSPGRRASSKKSSPSIPATHASRDRQPDVAPSQFRSMSSHNKDGSPKITKQVAKTAKFFPMGVGCPGPWADADNVDAYVMDQTMPPPRIMSPTPLLEHEIEGEADQLDPKAIESLDRAAAALEKVEPGADDSWWLEEELARRAQQRRSKERKRSISVTERIDELNARRESGKSKSLNAVNDETGAMDTSSMTVTERIHALNEARDRAKMAAAREPAKSAWLSPKSRGKAVVGGHDEGMQDRKPEAGPETPKSSEGHADVASYTNATTISSEKSAYQTELSPPRSESDVGSCVSQGAIEEESVASSFVEPPAVKRIFQAEGQPEHFLDFKNEESPSNVEEQPTSDGPTSLAGNGNELASSSVEDDNSASIAASGDVASETGQDDDKSCDSSKASVESNLEDNIVPRELGEDTATENEEENKALDQGTVAVYEGVNNAEDAEVADALSPLAVAVISDEYSGSSEDESCYTEQVGSESGASDFGNEDRSVSEASDPGDEVGSMTEASDSSADDEGSLLSETEDGEAESVSSTATSTRSGPSAVAEQKTSIFPNPAADEINQSVSSESTAALVDSLDVMMEDLEKCLPSRKAEDPQESISTTSMCTSTGSEVSASHAGLDAGAMSDGKPIVLPMINNDIGIPKGDSMISLLAENPDAPYSDRVKECVWRCRTMRQKCNTRWVCEKFQRKGHSPPQGRSSVQIDVDDARVVGGVGTVSRTHEAALEHLKYDELDDALLLLEDIISSYYGYFEGLVHEDNDTEAADNVTSFKPHMGSALHNIGVIQLLRSNFQEARDFFERAAMNRAESIGVGHSDYVTSLTKLALCRCALGDFAGARRDFEECILRMRGKITTIADYRQFAELLNNSACLAYRDGEVERAVTRFQESLRLQEIAARQCLYAGSKFSTQSLSVNSSIVEANLGFVALAMKEHPKSITLLEKAVGKQELLLWDAHTTLIATMDHLAVANYVCEERNQNMALQILRRMVNMQLEELGPNHPRTMATAGKIRMLENHESAVVVTDSNSGAPPSTKLRVSFHNQKGVRLPKMFKTRKKRKQTTARGGYDSMI